MYSVCQVKSRYTQVDWYVCIFRKERNAPSPKSELPSCLWIMFVLLSYTWQKLNCHVVIRCLVECACEHGGHVAVWLRQSMQHWMYGGACK